MSSGLQELAEKVGVSERTLRRGVDSGLIRARRASPRRLSLSEREIEWVGSHWSTVAELRRTLRTQPNVGLAVLFGSAARGDDVPGSSDLDLLVGLRRPDPETLETLRRRLGEQLAVDVQIVPLEATRRNPRLLSEILRDGRPLVDRERGWSALQARAGQTQVQADRMGDTLRAEARAALDYFRELAAARPPTSVGNGA